MKNTSMRRIVVAGAVLISISDGVSGQESAGSKETTNTVSPQSYSPLAAELIEFYTPRVTEKSRRKVNPYYSPDLSQEHLTEKCRAAWDEMILAVVAEPRDIRVLEIRPRIYSAIAIMAKPESVPVLKEALMRSAASGVDQKKMVRAQEYILSALTVVCSTNALDAILSSLDALDNVYGTNKPVRTSEGISLRELAFKFMINTNSCEVGLQSRNKIERTEAWKSIVMKWQEEKGLSQKNRGLAERAKAYKRPEKAMRE